MAARGQPVQQQGSWVPPPQVGAQAAVGSHRRCPPSACIVSVVFTASQ